ncbi:E3 SUMO-protein ligase RanBP2-like [Patiria miniata]|uniref:Nuclear pore complex protein Nup153 n=1 Tax=Patiria miniata TaxID=46514 RepID=A0A913ZEH0_PATMI|nr:E3 SUMO-protein ligase RanBP2-like [Patiria miniata]
MNTAIECMLDATEAAQEIVDSSEDGDFLMLCPLIEKGLDSHMNMRPEDIFQGLPHWTFQENTSATLGSLRDSSGYSYGQGSSFGNQPATQASELRSSFGKPKQASGLFGSSRSSLFGTVQSRCDQDAPCRLSGSSISRPRKKKKSSYFGGTQHSAQVQPAAVTVKVASEDFMEQLPPPPSGDIGSSQHQASSGIKGNSLQAKKKSFSSTFVTAATLDPSEMPGPEDDEELMYKQRAHIYHFARKLGIWKERGIGHVKLLRHKDIGALRLVMQLQQESKMVANHSITSDLKLNPLKSSDRSWVWTTTDFFEGVAGYGKFAIKFKTSELANEFKRHLEELQAARKLEEEEERKQPLVWSSFLNTTIREEDEDLMYKQQAAFCCFARHQGVWKVMEKGNGDVKILRLKDSGSLRLIVQHEQDSKICSSHSISAHMTTNLKSSDRLVWRFFDLSPSAGEVSYRYLSVKFKTSELAKEFKRRLEELQAIRKVEEEAAFAKKFQKSLTFGSSQSSDRSDDVHDVGEDDVIFISEKTPTPDQRARAEALLLPPTFFLYEDEPPCPGCPGCDPADLAARGKSSPTFVKPAAASVAHSQAPVFSTTSEQQTFGAITKTATTSVAKKTPTTSTTFDTQEGSKPSSTIFGASASGALTLTSFAHIKTDKQGTISEGSTKGFVFPKAGAPIFVASKEDPTVLLPELVECKTGEEDEEVMYKQRARLYRYAKDLAKWMERGIGDVKLLRHKESGTLRLIMRREQVLKLCANHRITPDMKLDPLQSSDRSWVWHAIDYSEDEPSHEQLAIKFKTAELAHEFKRRLEELQVARREEEEREAEQKTEAAAAAAEAVGDTQQDGKESKEEDATEVSDEPDQEAGSEDVFAKFKSQAGDWQCKMCMLSNRKDDTTCAACMTPKPGAAPQTGDSGSLPGILTFGGGGGFKFGSCDSAAKPVFQFGVPLTISSTTSLSTSGSSLSTGAVKFRATKSDTTLMAVKENTQAALTTTKFTFGGGFQKCNLRGAGDEAASPMAAVQNPSTGITFSANGSTLPKAGRAADTCTVASASLAVQVTPVKPSVGFIFGSKPATPTPTPTTKPKEEAPRGFSFADIAKSKGSSFSFRLDVSKTPDVSSDDNEYYTDDKGDHVHFEPVLELPENVEVKTGEEDEMAKFSHRAKLYRFDKDTSQWKERGLGDIKLLYSPANRKYRIVMRREQVLTVCANHYVTSELDLQSNAGSTKSWVWMAMDASEEQVQMEQLAVRFKTEETALEFKKAVDAAKQDIKKEGKEQTTEEKELEIDKEKENNLEIDDGGQATNEEEGEEDQGNNAEMKAFVEQEADVNNDDSKNVDNDCKAGVVHNIVLASASAAVHVTPVKPSAGFVYEAKPATSTQTTTKEETLMGFSFADMAKSKGSTFAFHLDITKSPEVNNSEKSPIKLRSPDIVSSPGNHIYFEPIVELPECTDLKTGEENETVKFSHQAKLYRFDKDSSQWKERGLGNIKLLFNPANLKYRIVMRREQVLKVCANHYVTPELNLQCYAGSTKSWVWMAMDASEDEVQMEQLAVRFREEETTREFKKAVDAAKEDIKKEGKEQTKEEAGRNCKQNENIKEEAGGHATKEVDGEEDQDDSGVSNMQDEQEAEGDVGNDDNDEDNEDVDDVDGVDDDDDEDKDEQVKDKDEQVEDKNEQIKDKDEHAEDKDEQVEDKDEQVEDKDEQVEDKDEQVEDKDEQVKDKDEQVKDKGEQNEDKDDKEVQEISTEGDSDLPIVKSCDPNISKAFSELLRSANASNAQKPKVEEAAPTSTTDSISKEEDATAASSKVDSVSEERDNIHFEPVAHLPEQVEKVTGEEDESQLFCSRAKLYRYDKATTRWKDRGIGDIKILHNTQRKKYRIIMRRDQVFRVCANHYITKEMSLAPNAGSENSLVWQAMDAADGDPQMEQLAVRFKLAGTTQRFKAVFEECQAVLRKQTQQS